MNAYMLRKIAGQTNILTIPRIFIDIAGDHESALFLSQCIYWYDKMGRPFYKTYADWQSELHMTDYALDKARKKLEGIVITELHRANGAPTLHYSINYDELEKRVSDLSISTNGFVDPQQMDLSNIDNSITETTTKNTTLFDEPIYEDFVDEDFAEPKKKPKPKGNAYAIAKVIGDVCQMDFEMNERRLLKEANILSKKPYVSPEIIYQIYGKGGAWYKFDWRGKTGQLPRPELIKETLLILQKTDEGAKNITGDVRSRK